MPEAIVQLTSVSKVFPHALKPALQSINVNLTAGKVTGLVGPDGAGKTTLMRLMAGLLSPTSGQVRVNGLDPVRNADSLYEVIGYMPQKFGLYEDLSVEENLTLYADLRGVIGEERKQVFQKLLEFTSLGPFVERLAGKLSGGMKQKLGLACSLLGRPKLLLLDEPSVGVDPISRRELWKMVKGLAGDGMSVVWSTAYLDEAELCDETILLNEGAMLYAGNPQEFTSRVAGRSVHLRNIAGNRRQLLTKALRCPEVMDGVIQGRNVRLVLRQKGQRPHLEEFSSGLEMVPVAPRFEDAFIDILGGGPGGESVLAARTEQLPGTHETVIEAVGLTKKFGSFAATDQVNFQVARGEVFGLLGPNGAGKSTTFKMMCGLLTPTAGSARVMGIDLATSASEARQQLGYMAQKFSLYGNLTVKQNLRFFSGVYGLKRARQKEVVDEMIEVFNLQPYLEVTPDTLSLGYKQRLALACAVTHGPSILFLDEPTSGVDPVTRREFWTHINGLVEKGVTVMVTTHFMDEAEYCDRIGLVYRGKLIAIGTPDDLKAGVASDALPDPTMEDAFVELVLQHDRTTS